MNLYVSKNSDARWYTIGNNYCVHCETELEFSCIASIKWIFQQPPEILLFCHNCIEKRYLTPYNHFERKGVILSLLPVSVVPERPKGVRVWIPFPPDFSNGRISTIDAANPHNDKKMLCDSDGYTIEDKTVFAGRESFEGAQIGVVDSDLLEDKDKPVESEEEVAKLLKGFCQTNQSLEDKRGDSV